MSQLQQTMVPLLSAQETQFWKDKVMSWGPAHSPHIQRDTSLHLRRLSGYLQQLLTHINNLSSTAETMKRLPFLGQFLGRLCWNPHVTADGESRALLFQCLWGLYSENPSVAVERKANQWIRKVLCQLATEEDDAATQELLKHVGVSSKEYHIQVLRKMVSLLQENIGKGCSAPANLHQSCSCDGLMATSEVCIPLISCPAAAPLIGALLQQTSTCARAALSQDFLDAVRSSYSSQSLSLEDQAVISLWYHCLPSLEEAMLSLLESVVTHTEATTHTMMQQVSQSLLPKACAQHCSIFVVVNDILRSTLKESEGNSSVKLLIEAFTRCFLKELQLLQPQMCASLKAFFPQSPQSVLLPLLTLPSEMPEEAWTRHLNWLSGSLQRLIEEAEEEEEEEEGDSSSGTRGHYKVFEAWFLLLQCAHWVQVTLQLLATEELEECGPLLWLLTFYHHPTNRGHNRDAQLVQCREARSLLRSLFSPSGEPPPDGRLQPLLAVMSPPPQQPSLTLQLLFSFAVFSQQPLSVSTHILETVVRQSGVVKEAACVLFSLGSRLNAGSSLSSDADRVHVRTQALQNTLTHMQAVWSPAESQAL